MDQQQSQSTLHKSAHNHTLYGSATVSVNIAQVSTQPYFVWISNSLSQHCTSQHTTILCMDQQQSQPTLHKSAHNHTLYGSATVSVNIAQVSTQPYFVWISNSLSQHCTSQHTTILCMDQLQSQSTLHKSAHNHTLYGSATVSVNIAQVSTQPYFVWISNSLSQHCTSQHTTILCMDQLQSQSTLHKSAHNNTLLLIC